MKYKDLTTEAVRDVDQVKGIVTGYFSVFGNKDSDGDIVMPGAFKKTIKENGPESGHPRILHLYQHDSWKVLGKPSVLKEDKKGLYFETEISKTPLGKDVLQLYIDKVLTEHSIGYQIMKREIDDPDQDYRTRTQYLHELKLWEGSTVSWGANMEALVDSIKSEVDSKDSSVKWLIDKMDALETAVKGNYTDETARQLEISLEQIKSAIISLVRKEKPVESTSQPVKPIMTIDADWVLKRININI